LLGALRLLNRHCGHSGKRAGIFRNAFDSWQVAIALRANPKTKMIPILATSADISPRDLAACLEAGCNGYIVKPFSVVDLHIKIREMLAAPFAAEV
jgi:CheY-like chemotaxis protein